MERREVRIRWMHISCDEEIVRRCLSVKNCDETVNRSSHKDNKQTGVSQCTCDRTKSLQCLLNSYMNSQN